MSKDPKAFIQDLQKTFKMKGVGPPDYHLGGNFERLSNGKLMQYPELGTLNVYENKLQKIRSCKDLMRIFDDVICS